jgi:ABC-type antimicrobial peptide transport system permease subunit
MLFANFAGAFGSTALFLVCVGLYGVVSYSVARRTHEIGIRMALGAQGSNVRMMVLRETLLLISAGVVLGVAAVVSLMPRIQSMLFGLPPNDPTTLAIAIGLMAGLAAFAGYVPARRASRVDPLTALRYE